MAKCLSCISSWEKRQLVCEQTSVKEFKYINARHTKCIQKDREEKIQCTGVKRRFPCSSKFFTEANITVPSLLFIMRCCCTTSVNLLHLKRNEIKWLQLVFGTRLEFVFSFKQKLNEIEPHSSSFIRMCIHFSWDHVDYWPETMKFLYCFRFDILLSDFNFNWCNKDIITWQKFF